MRITDSYCGSNPALALLVSVVPLRLIAYYDALYRGFDVDKPRNLAKSKFKNKRMENKF
jgi:Glucosamine 6-phosphate synthetase, contains amidotransferase and phosphosugar isomerase domains